MFNELYCRKRPTAQVCLDSVWMKKATLPRNNNLRPRPIHTARLAHFVDRRKHLVSKYRAHFVDSINIW